MRGQRLVVALALLVVRKSLFWPLPPAAEATQGLASDSRLSRGDVRPFEADLVVNVVGDRDRCDFTPLHERQWRTFDARAAEGLACRSDPSGGTRLVHPEGPDNRSSFLLTGPQDAGSAGRAPDYGLSRLAARPR